MEQPTEIRISMPKLEYGQPTHIKASSYESWLRFVGAFELANELNSGDLPANGNQAERETERQGLPWYAHHIEHLFKNKQPPVAFISVRGSL